MRFVSAKKGGINTKVIKNRKPRPSIDKRGFFKTAATYSPTVTQYHRRDEAQLLCSEWEEVEPSCYNHLNKVMT